MSPGLALHNYQHGPAEARGKARPCRGRRRERLRAATTRPRGSAVTWQARTLERLRYPLLLPVVARCPGLARLYARLVAHSELAKDPARSGVAIRRIEAWLDLSRSRAAAIFRETLESEAFEEADFASRIRQPPTLRAEDFEVVGALPQHDVPTLYVTLHFGSPVMAFVWLRLVAGLDIHIVGRPLDDRNPMPKGRRTLGHRKVAWLEALAGSPMLGTDERATLEARRLLLEGGSLFAAGDVPGDIASRSAEISPFGEKIRVAAGIYALARSSDVKVRGIVARPLAGGRFAIDLGAALQASPLDAPPPEMVAEMARLLRRHPGRWWMWPHLVAARPPGSAGIWSPPEAS